MFTRSPMVKTTCLLGIGQILAWGSSYYLGAILADPASRDLDISVPFFFAAFSLALVIAAIVGPLVGNLIDRGHGRRILMGSNCCFAVALVLLGESSGAGTLLIAWALMGIAMGAGLYDAAFSTLIHIHGSGARKAIIGVTLIAGFASTIGWPLSTWLTTDFGWREACFVWAGLQLCVGVPLNIGMPARESEGPTAATERVHELKSTVSKPGQSSKTPTALFLSASTWIAFVFAVTWFVSTAMAAHLPRLLMIDGFGAGTAVAIAALIGPAQVAARLLEFVYARYVGPLTSARMAMLGHPAGVLILTLGGIAAAPVFAILHGLGNGILTVAKGTLPLALFGARGYGRRQGWLMMPATLAQAAAPLVFGLIIERFGLYALWFSAALELLAFLVLLLVKNRRNAQCMARVCHHEEIVNSCIHE